MGEVPSIRLLDPFSCRYVITINELAAAEKTSASYVSRVLRLTLLAPEIVEAILDGRQPEGMTLPVLMQSQPETWIEQRRQCAPQQPTAPLSRTI